MNNLESVFDHSITPKEIKDLHLFVQDKEVYLNNTSEYERFIDISALYFQRGEQKKAKEYLILAQKYSEFAKFY